MSSTNAFNPYNQTITLLMADGTPFNITMVDLDEFVQFDVLTCINFASQLGASLALLVVMILLTKGEKRWSPIFCLNGMALLLNFVRMLMGCVYFTGPFNETYAYFSGDYSEVSSGSYALSIASIVLTWILLVILECSLLLQARVICFTLRKVYRQAILVASILIAGIPIGLRLALVVENAQLILQAAVQNNLTEVNEAVAISFIISICFFCVIFVAKLGFALRQRKKLGLRRFGPMHVVFIMGCQTIILPAFFSILIYFINLPSADSEVYTLVAIFLPLSSLWAASTLDGNNSTSRNATSTKRKLWGGSYRTISTSKDKNGSVESDNSTIVSNSPNHAYAKAAVGGDAYDMQGITVTRDVVVEHNMV